ncbi:MAG: hypothetical protein J6X78_13510 [Treponema sp.]|nr:hypothetical protein [Treponema sp.]
MTIEQYAAAQGLEKITCYTVNGKQVYRLQNKDGGCVGLPYFAIPTADGFRQATTSEIAIKKEVM